MKKKYLLLVILLLCCTLFTPNFGKAAEKEKFKVCGNEALQLSVNCKEGDEITFKCESCPTFKYEYTGYSGITIGNWSKISKYYDVTFGTAGEYELQMYKNNVLNDAQKVVVYSEHKFDNGVVTKQATCTAKGEITYTCSNCGKADKKETDIIPHDYGEAKITRQPTCTQDGVKTMTCKNCSFVYSEFIKAIGHKIADDYTIDKEPTCTEKGTKSKHCERCNYKSDVVEIDALGHDFGDWECQTKEDIFNDGIYVKECKRCHEQSGDIMRVDKIKTKVILTKKNVKIKKGTKLKLKIKYKHKDDIIAKWTTKNNKVVKINSKTGVITGAKKGKTTIKLTMKSGCTATCKVTVK